MAKIKNTKCAEIKFSTVSLPTRRLNHVVTAAERKELRTSRWLHYEKI